jgi:hypothetical protein
MLTPFWTVISLCDSNNVVEVPKDKLLAFNDSVEGARIWSPALKAEMLKTKKKRKSITVSKAKTSVAKLQSAMKFAEEVREESLAADLPLCIRDYFQVFYFKGSSSLLTRFPPSCLRVMDCSA